MTYVLSNSFQFMSSSATAPFTRTYLGAVLFALALSSSFLCAQTNLITNGSFESGNWDGTQAFVDSNNATGLMFWNTQVANWIPDSNSTWVQDATRASDQNRFVWLGPPGLPYNQAITYIAQTVATSSLAAGQSYHLGLDYDFFNPSDANGASPMTSTLKVYYMLGTSMDMGQGSVMLTDDTNTLASLFTETDMTDAWNNPGGLQWTQGGINFTMPNLSGYDYLRVFLAAPANDGTTSSMGVLVDNVSLSLTVIPEPGSLILAAIGVAGLVGQRRRSITA
ncbi:MAG: hypothetical protein JWO94_1366 [Verrucomicrobiaceae bacterium]|nr:hypothetical protein [Verrucomicrobiaceae bacterium]